MESLTLRALRSLHLHLLENAQMDAEQATVEREVEKLEEAKAGLERDRDLLREEHERLKEEEALLEQVELDLREQKVTLDRERQLLTSHSARVGLRGGHVPSGLTGGAPKGNQSCWSLRNLPSMIQGKKQGDWEDRTEVSIEGEKGGDVEESEIIISNEKREEGSWSHAKVPRREERKRYRLPYGRGGSRGEEGELGSPDKSAPKLLMDGEDARGQPEPVSPSCSGRGEILGSFHGSSPEPQGFISPSASSHREGDGSPPAMIAGSPIPGLAFGTLSPPCPKLVPATDWSPLLAPSPNHALSLSRGTAGPDSRFSLSHSSPSPDVDSSTEWGRANPGGPVCPDEEGSSTHAGSALLIPKLEEENRHANIPGHSESRAALLISAPSPESSTLRGGSSTNRATRGCTQEQEPCPGPDAIRPAVAASGSDEAVSEMCEHTRGRACPVPVSDREASLGAAALQVSDLVGEVSYCAACGVRRRPTSCGNVSLMELQGLGPGVGPMGEFAEERVYCGARCEAVGKNLATQLARVLQQEGAVVSLIRRAISQHRAVLARCDRASQLYDSLLAQRDIVTAQYNKVLMLKRQIIDEMKAFKAERDNLFMV